MISHRNPISRGVVGEKEREQNITIAVEVDLLFIIQNFANTFKSIKFIHREKNQVLQSFALDMDL